MRLGAGALRELVRETLLAFANGDLLDAGRALLQGARGSFGLVLSHSLDCHSDFLVAARGQTMSIGGQPVAGVARLPRVAGREAPREAYP